MEPLVKGEIEVKDGVDGPPCDYRKDEGSGVW